MLRQNGEIALDFLRDDRRQSFQQDFIQYVWHAPGHADHELVEVFFAEAIFKIRQERHGALRIAK